MGAHGGGITLEELSEYRPVWRSPVRSRYRGYDVLGFPPPSSGGVHVAQILNILEHFDLKALGRDHPDWVHLVVEAMKWAFADRAHWLGDPDYADVPRGLVSPDYARSLAARIRVDQASEVPSHGMPPHAREDLFASHTTHYSTADQEGWWVACTATINTTLGSKVMVPGTGVVLNNEMDDFSAQPGKPNFFGLLGSEANAVQAGKRPLSSMSPTLVLKDGTPMLSIGAAGGPTIISQTLVHLLLMIDFVRDLEQSLAHPRFHHQWIPNRIVMEAAWPPSVIDALRAKGHEVQVVPRLGASQGVSWWGGDPSFQGGADPRVEGSARLWPATASA
ncbi:MAG: gamma-glutamyltransferase, partial [Flavobacteriales bacterium]|nr:gamma-glutamyltransferase [Flavobacteriales bacterium]